MSYNSFLGVGLRCPEEGEETVSRCGQSSIHFISFNHSLLVMLFV